MAFWAIGDLHGNTPALEAICENIRKQDPDAITFQVGDLGIGFTGVKQPELGLNDYFIAGNHDDAVICAQNPHCLGDFGCRTFGDKKVFWLRGAMSTDREHRIAGVTWWEYEELNYKQLMDAIALYEVERPDLVITHDCPTQIRTEWFYPRGGGKTVQALTNMFEAHQPEFWCFGHHHTHKAGFLDGTYFRCLAELHHKKIQIDRMFDE